MPGPPKQSNAFKRAKGSTKIHAGQDLAPSLLKKMPNVPSDLEEIGRKEWRRVCALLIEQEILTEWDLPALKIMCMEWERYLGAVLDIREHGTYQTAQSGYEQTRPVVAERDKGFANYHRLLERFGGNVVARSKMKRIKPSEGKKNTFASI